MALAHAAFGFPGVRGSPGENESDEPKFGVRQSNRNETEEQSLCKDSGVRDPAVLGTHKSSGILCLHVRYKPDFGRN